MTHCPIDAGRDSGTPDQRLTTAQPTTLKDGHQTMTTAHNQPTTTQSKNDDQKTKTARETPKCHPSANSFSKGTRGNSTRSERLASVRKGNQELTCKNGEAISYIDFTEADDGYQTYEIKCANIADAQNVASSALSARKKNQLRRHAPLV